MKFLTLLLIVFAFSAKARTDAQTITINVKDAKLSVVFQKIKQQTGYNFFYNESLLKTARPVTLNIKDGSLQNALKQCFREQPFSYVVMDRMIIVKEKELSFHTNKSPKTVRNFQEDIIISGHVTDSIGAPLSGVTISIMGTKKGTISNANGNYMLSANKGDTLEFTSVGYQTQRIVIGERTDVDVKMKLAQNNMEDVVVVGYGTQRKESVVGAVTTINPRDLIQSNTQLSQSFAGRLSGVISTTTSGEPGNNSASFWIRGVATLGTTTPLIFMDGVEISTSDMNAIDPSNIQAFSILKDASATALYGARGANGVILITMKHGQIRDKPNISGIIENSFLSPTKIVKFTDAVNYMELYNEARANENPTEDPKYSDEKIQGTKDGKNPYVFPNVDWYNSLFKKFSTTQHATLSVRGGSKTVRYYSGASFYNENGILRNAPQNDFKNNIVNQRYNFVNNLDMTLSPTTTMELNLNADFVKYQGPATTVSTIFSEVMNSNPVDFPMYYPSSADEDASSHILFGNMTGGYYTDNTFKNPYADMVDGYKNQFSSTILANLRITQKLDFITPGLSAYGLASIKNWSYSSISRSYTPYYYQLGSYSDDDNDGIYDYAISQIGSGGSETLTQSGSSDGDRTIYLQGNLDYNRRFGKHAVTGLLLYQQREYDVNEPGSSITSSLPYRYQGISGRYTYGYDDRYFLETNFGYTGSENFASGHRFGFFPSIGFGYMLSNEKFFDPIKKVITSLKFRGSYGTSGNDQLSSGRFPYLGEVSLSGDGFTWGKNFDNTYSGITIDQYENRNITWEKSKKLNLGMDITLFNNLTLNLDVYSEIRDKIFQQRATIPNTVGVGDADLYANIDKVKNKGIDITFNYHRQMGKDLFLAIKGTFTYAHNVVLAYDESIAYSYLSRIGRPVNQLYGLVAEQLFSSDDDVSNSPTQSFTSTVAAGDIKYKNESALIGGGSDDQIDANDKVPMGHPSVPEINYGFGFDVVYKKFDLDVYFEGVANVSFFLNSIHPFGDYRNNVLEAVADNHWSSTNQDVHAFYPRLTESSNQNNTQNSSWWLRSASFLRLKNTSLGYSPTKRFRIYANTENILTFSPFKLWDPELSINTGTGNGLSYPPQKKVTVGLQINLN